MFVLATALVWAIFQSLAFYTRHGESIKVPNLRGMSLEQADKYLQSRNLRYAVIDSSYNKDLPSESVIDQNPKPDATVKENRRIYLTLNAKTPPLVKIPEILYASLRNAEVQLQSVGLEVGEMKYVPDLAKNAVLDIRLKGVSVKPGTDVPKGTAIDLVLGNGLGTTRVNVPNLVGMTFLEAKLTLRAYDLNLGAVLKTGAITNEETAVVYKQNPDAGANNDRQITVGEPIDLFLKEGEKIESTPIPVPPSPADTSKQPIPTDNIDAPADSTKEPLD